MPSPKKPPARKKRQVKQPRKCGGCGQLGHDRSNCPVPNLPAAHPRARKQVVDEVSVDEVSLDHPPPTTVVEDASNINWECILYVVFDLETTGCSWQFSEIIEVAGQIIDPNGIQLEDGIFSQLVKPNSTISPFITELTSITNDSVSDAERFPVVADAFIRFMRRQADNFSASRQLMIEHIILVAHNGKVFDIPFFVHLLSNYEMLDFFFKDK